MDAESVGTINWLNSEGASLIVCIVAESVGVEEYLEVLVVGIVNQKACNSRLATGRMIGRIMGYVVFNVSSVL